jgi:FlaG/FlaF family flagellin (archaellin)
LERLKAKIHPVSHVEVTGSSPVAPTMTPTATMRVKFTGSAATPENVNQIVNRDNSLEISGSQVKVEVVATDKPVNGVLNTMDFSPGVGLQDVSYGW